MPRVRAWVWEQFRFDAHPLLNKLVKFSLVGGSGVVVNTAFLYFFYEMGHLPMVLASALAVEIAIANNFVWNHRWTFGQGTFSMPRFLRFNLVSAGGLAITTGMLYLLSTVGLYYLAANLVGIALATAWNFVLSIRWTWGWDN